MREIKFKGWHKEKKIMFDVFGFDVNHVYPFKTEGLEIPPEREEVELMQYTGVQDETGDDIYEGDIIEAGYVNQLTKEFESRKYLIEYKNEHYKGKLIGHSPYGDTWLEFIQGEIIGNIYQNPELLNSQK